MGIFMVSNEAGRAMVRISAFVFSKPVYLAAKNLNTFLKILISYPLKKLHFPHILKCRLQTSSIEDCQHFGHNDAQCVIYDELWHTMTHSVTLELWQIFKNKKCEFGRLSSSLIE